MFPGDHFFLNTAQEFLLGFLAERLERLVAEIGRPS
jgi:surfactin synthase thioesterase subunit